MLTVRKIAKKTNTYLIDFFFVFIWLKTVEIEKMCFLTFYGTKKIL